VTALCLWAIAGFGNVAEARSQAPEANANAGPSLGAPGQSSVAGNMPTGSTDGTLKLPSDVAFLLRPSDAKIPALPAGFDTKDVGGWLHIAYPHGTEARIDEALTGLEAFRDELRAELGDNVLRQVEVRVVREPEDFAKHAPFATPSYASGLSFGGLRYVLASMKAPKSYEGVDVGQTLRHELAHVAFDDAFGSGGVPRWFNEGYAMLKAGETRMHAEALSSAVYMHTLIPLAELERRFPDEHDPFQVSVAYGEAADFVRFLLRGSDRGRFRSAVSRIQSGAAFERALADAYGSDLRTLEYQWRKDLESRSGNLSAVMTGSLLWVFAFIALVVGYFRRKKTHNRIVQGWEQEEAELARLAEEVKRSAETEDTFRPVPLVLVPKVEHEGTWHTLH
jgi:hypothetical protein